MTTIELIAIGFVVFLIIENSKNNRAITASRNQNIAKSETEKILISAAAIEAYNLGYNHISFASITKEIKDKYPNDNTIDCPWDIFLRAYKLGWNDKTMSIAPKTTDIEILTSIGYSNS